VSTPDRRPYDSPLRRGQAAATRAAIIAAATRLFVERGYGATSIDDIAREAGVSRATVFTAVGPKRTLLKTAYDVALVGDDEPVPMPQRPWAQGVRRATTVPDMLEAYADLIVLVGGRIGAIAEAIRGAAASEPEAREVFQKIEEERLTGARNIVAMAVERGGIRAGLDHAVAADIIWVLNDPGLYVRLVVRRGWTTADFRDWLAEALRSQLL
jgi:AcrR family transcriptional regulator